MKANEMILVILLLMLLISTLLLIACQKQEYPSQEATSEHSGDITDNKTHRQYSIITPHEAKQKLKQEENVFLIDVRTPAEYQEGHIKDSILIPLDELADKVEGIVIDKNDIIIVYCRTGRRTKVAAQILLDKGYINVYDLEGITTWPYEIEK